MKLFKILFLVVFLGFTSTIFSQLLLEDNFNYELGELQEKSNSVWIMDPDGSVDIEVISGNLSYSGYASSGVGNMIKLDDGSDSRTDVTHFLTSSISDNTIFVSFLMNLTSTSEFDDVALPDGDTFFALNVPNSTSRRSMLYVKTGPTGDGSDYYLGIAKASSSSLTYAPGALNTGKTYLIVVAYVFNSGSSTNDISKLWINPTLDGTEPDAVVSVTSGADADKLGEISFRQQDKSGDIEIDGVRISTSWDQAPLPVELVSFTAENVNEGIELKWLTATEVNNYGFDIQRSFKQSEFETIGFVEGHGNSNSPKEYEFVDVNPPSGNLEYRLKQIDTDGSFEYFSLTAKVDNQITDVNDDLIPNSFKLSQNFPNPFNPTTQIKYEIPESGHVELKVFDMLGKEVATVVNEVQCAGSHTVHFNAAELSSGVYIYSLKFNDYYDAKKLTLIY